MKFLTILFLLYSSLIFSQINSGRIEYAAEFNSDFIRKNVKSKSKNVTKFYSELESQIKSIQTELSFNKKKSEFKIIDALSQDGNELANRFAKDIIADGTYYISGANVVKLKNSGGTTFIISIEDLKWNITKETDYIEGYKVYKATGEKKFKNAISGKNKVILVEAWFSPEINFSYGPKGRHGLPGLILKLIEGPVTYKANKIELFLKDKTNIEVPNNGNRMTERKFNELMGGKLKEMF